MHVTSAITQLFPRGSEWRQWDLHIHTPASFQWSGQRFALMNETEKRAQIDKMIDALNTAEPTVFALMDYWTFDGWFALKQRLNESGAPKLTKLVLPGIELRLVSPTTYRLNAHVIFSNEISDQELIDFKGHLKLALTGKSLSDEALRHLARQTDDNKLKDIGTSKSSVNGSDDHALIAGSKIAEIIAVTYQEAIETVPNNLAIGFMPWDTYNGLKDADWLRHYSYVKSLMWSSTIFETRKESTWGAFVGQILPGNESFYKPFREALNHEFKLAVSGSDAHQINHYGVFPNSKPTWIKADPTWLGLLQAIKEPAKRSYIGEIPPKLKLVSENKSFFIDTVAVSKNKYSTLPDIWLDGNKIPLNNDLVAIIGNKGSGKSALTDVIALLGNTRLTTKFSFLDKKRFRNPKQKLAENFTGKLSWVGGAGDISKLLSTDIDSSKVELVRYIPQSYFEDLCNDHASGVSNAFQEELESVIFSHVPISVRGDSLNFQQLIQRKESVLNDGIAEHTKSLRQTNIKISTIEEELSPKYRLEAEELIKLKQAQIDEHAKGKPLAPVLPTDKLDDNQQKAADRIVEINGRLHNIVIEHETLSDSKAKNNRKLNAILSIQGRLDILKGQLIAFQTNTQGEFDELGIKFEDVFNYKISDQELINSQSLIKANEAQNEKAVNDLNFETDKLGIEKINLQKQLNEPQQKYQIELAALSNWEKKKNDLRGTAAIPDSLEGLKARLEQIKALPVTLKALMSERLNLMRKIFELLNQKRQLREDFFAPLQNLLNNNSLIKTEYQLNFQAKLGFSVDAFANFIFDNFKVTHGEFKGQKESFDLIEKVLQSNDLSSESGVELFLNEILGKLVKSAQEMPSKLGPGIANGMKSNKSDTQLYDFLFGLQFLTPKYTMKFQNTPIEFLSPGQRGALLLIFYLLVDTGHTPIILDQPEENLDNQTIVSLLVPVLTEAKKLRQIIMVTHNPNLAVVCDAEQLIYASFDKSNGNKIEYQSGSIEYAVINTHTVNVLEGTKLAFDNRRVKYHS